MRIHVGFAAVAAVCCSLAAPSGARAGQVVSAEDRQWAKSALQQEKSVEGRAAGSAVGVLYFRNRTGDASLDPLQKGLALMLITDLASVDGVQVVERVRLQALLEELGLGKTGLVEESSAPRVGRLLGARWLVGGDIEGAPLPRARVSSQVLDVPKGEAVGRSSATGEVDEFFRLEKDLLFGILGSFRTKLTPAQESNLRRPCSRNTRALLSLFKGVDASDAGDYEGAAEAYERALDEDPSICLAGPNLKELQARRLVGGRVPSRSLLRSVRAETSLTNRLAPKDQTRPFLVPRQRESPNEVPAAFSEPAAAVGKGGRP